MDLPYRTCRSPAKGPGISGGTPTHVPPTHPFTAQSSQILQPFTQVWDHEDKDQGAEEYVCARAHSTHPCVRFTLRGSMTKQLQATLAAIMVMSTISVRAQLSTTTTTQKTSPNTTKTTVVTSDRSGNKSTAAKRSATRRSTAKKAPAESTTAREIRELREQMLNQQAQIDALKQQNADKDARLAAAQSDAQAASASAASANRPGPEPAAP